MYRAGFLAVISWVMLYEGRPSVIRLRCGMVWSGLRLAIFQAAIIRVKSPILLAPSGTE